MDLSEIVLVMVKHKYQINDLFASWLIYITNFCRTRFSLLSSISQAILVSELGVGMTDHILDLERS